MRLDVRAQVGSRVGNSAPAVGLKDSMAVVLRIDNWLRGGGHALDASWAVCLVIVQEVAAR